MNTTTPHKPDDFGARAAELWDRITADYELRVDEVELLVEACREVDVIERLEAELRDAPLSVKGGRGQVISHPLLGEVRQHRAVLKSLLGGLKLTDQADGERRARTGTSRSTTARAAAMQRWRTS